MNAFLNQKQGDLIPLQVTIFSNCGYRPISAIVNVESVIWANEHMADIKKSGIEKICRKKYWDKRDLSQYGYTRCKVRLYEKGGWE